MRRVTWIKLLCILAVLTVGRFLLFSVDYLSDGQTTCLFDALGRPCLGCNILSAWQALKRGDIGGAFKLNPLIFIWVLSAGILLVSEGWTFVKRIVFLDEKANSVGDWLILKMFKGIKKEEMNDVLPKMWKRNRR